MTPSNKDDLFSKLVKEHQKRIFRLCLGYLNDEQDANDLLQEILLAIWLNLDQFRGDSAISTWIYRISVNTALMHKRKKSRHLEKHDSFDEVTSGIHSEANSDQSELMKALRNCISGLAEQERVIITLSLEGFSYEEIAGITGITVTNTGAKLNRIKQKLTVCMKEKYPDEF